MTKEDVLTDTVSSEEFKRSKVVKDIDIDISVRSSCLSLKEIQKLIDTLIQTTMKLYEVVRVDSTLIVKVQDTKTLNSLRVLLQEAESEETKSQSE